MEIRKFTEEYAFLSNFFPARFTYLGHLVFSAEHAFQLAKTGGLGDQQAIAAAPTPSSAKALGRKVRLRQDWEAVKTSVMREIILLKFLSCPALRTSLLETENKILIEGNSWGDTFWGVDEKTGKGENMLGKILMETRNLIKNG